MTAAMLLTPILQGAFFLSPMFNRGFVVKARCMLWAAHCVAVATLSTMEIRAQETAQKQQQLHRTPPSALGCNLQQQQQYSSPSACRLNIDSCNAISISQLKRQLLAHVLDLPLAARSAGIQVVARAARIAAAP